MDESTCVIGMQYVESIENAEDAEDADRRFCTIETRDARDLAPF